jgi:uncharacterized membrane protein
MHLIGDGSKESSRRLLLTMILIIVVGAISRFYELGKNSFWIDEILSINDALRLNNIREFLIPSENAQPKLYFLLLHFWMKLGNGEFFLRTISVIFGLLFIGVVYFLGKEIYGSRVGVLAAFAVAISPFHLLYDRELRMYSMFAFLSASSLYFFIQSLRNNKRLSWGMYTLFTLLNLYTHYHAFLLIFAQWVYLIFNFNKYKKLLPRLMVCNIISGIFFMPWVLNGMLDNFHRLSPWMRFQDVFPIRRFGYILKPLYVLYGLCLGQTLLPWKFWGIVGIGLFICVSIIALANFRRDLESNKLVVIIITAMLIPGVLVSYALPRYYIWLAPLMYMFFIASFEKIKKNRLISILFISILFCWAVGLNNYYNGREFHLLGQIDPWRDAGRYLTERASKDDLIINIGGEPLGYYYSGKSSSYCYPQPFSASEETNVHEELMMKLVTKKRWANIWFLTNDPRYKALSERTKDWLDNNYILIGEKRYLRDPEYLTKARFFNKDFLEYRISIYHYKS